MRYYRQFNLKSQKGFTLVELLVVMVIMVTIMATLLVGQDNFYDKFEVDQKIYDLALAVRKAQTYSLGAREHNCSGTKTFDVSYGVYLLTTNASDREKFHFFMDANKNYKNDDAACYKSEVTFSLPGIDRICGRTTANASRCFPADAAGPRQISITFLRPNPKPLMKFYNAGGTEITALQDTGVAPANNPTLHNFMATYVYFKYAGGSKEAEVKIDATGQVSVRYCTGLCS